MKKMNKVVIGRCRYLMAAVFAVLCTAAMTLPAATTSKWKGGTSGIWGASYPGNWDAYPDSTHYATFIDPETDPITVQVDETVAAYGVVSGAGRTAGLNFIGSGTFENYRGALFNPGDGPSLTDWKINVASRVTSTQIYGTNIFHKTLDCSAVDTFTLMSGAKVTLCDSARLPGQRLSLSANSVLECLGPSTVSITKDLTAAPGSSLKVATNAVVSVRGLTLPLSREAGVSDEWTLDGGFVCATNTSRTYSLVSPYTNATKTVSGSGTLMINVLNFSSATNMRFRLNGPDLYTRTVAGNYKWNNILEVDGGSTIGAWGTNNVNFSAYSLKFAGSAAIDTTDFLDKTTPSSITLTRFASCSGDLVVKGNGTLKLGAPMTQPNLNLTLQDSTTFDTQTQYVYALGDFVLKDSASFATTLYIGHKGNTAECVKSLTMSGDSTLSIARYADISGDVSLSGNASAVIWNYKKESDPLSCVNLSLSDNASLSVMTGTVSATSISLSGNSSLSVASTVSATSLAMSGDAHISFTAGTGFTAGATFGDGNWTMDIKIPASYEAGIRPIVTGVEFGDDFASHVTLAGETNGWSVGVLEGVPVLYKGAAASGLEWTGGSSTSDNWSDSDNWNGGTLPTNTSVIAFGGINRRTPYNDLLASASGIVFRASSGPFTLSGSGSAERLKLVADCNSRGSASEAKANIVSHSGFVQTFDVPLEFPRCAYVLSDGGAEVVLKKGFAQGTTTDWQYFIAGGEVAIGGTCTADKLGFRTAASGKPTTSLRLMPGCTFTLSHQGDNSFTEGASYIGRFVIEEGAQILMQGGECSFFYGTLQNVVNGTLKVEGDGRLISGPNEQYYTGSGTIYAARALACRHTESKSHYINFGGSLKLYMNGDWNTASYYHNGTSLMQDPNAPTRLRMTDGTTLGATADWTYGPAADAFNLTNETVTASNRKAAMEGTVTIETQDPNDATVSHDITFVDSLDASGATVVKNGAGALVFNTPADCQPQFGSLVVNGGLVSFNAAQTFTGTLTLAAGTQYRADAAVADAGWTTIATATEITGPGGATEWKTDDGVYKFRIVTSGGTSRLECTKDTGVMVLFL